MTESVFSYPLKESAEPLKNSSSRLKKNLLGDEVLLGSWMEKTDQGRKTCQSSVSWRKSQTVIKHAVHTCLLPEEKELLILKVELDYSLGVITLVHFSYNKDFFHLG